MKVLFCGEELCYSYIYTAEALQDDQSIQVRLSADRLVAATLHILWC